MSQDEENTATAIHPRVVDFEEVRAQKLEEKRRKTERIFFKQILGIYSVTQEDQMAAIDIVDISEDGLAFQLPFDKNRSWPLDGSDLSIRLYFSQETYLPLTIRVVNTRPSIEEGVRFTRFGCKVDTSIGSYQAYQQFVRFLRAYSEHAHKDQGKVSFFYL